MGRMKESPHWGSIWGGNGKNTKQISNSWFGMGWIAYLESFKLFFGQFI
jgi:hypothetical protein